ncbi:MAG: ABC transporter ATP-binding protein/permease [Mollicutes bacterium]|nr:ABC transporter ATP-binding protein/permease [Mollicutes bacterium]MDD7263488.1 ABC transporter ATP-binding protein [bacterium]MDY4979736.1 ABC transporter ATP-binding protein [Candidatus Onthovivens sp.]
MYKQIFHFLKPYKKETILAIVFLVLETILEITVPFLMNFILQNNLGINYGPDNIITNVNYPIVYSVGGAMIICAILAFIFGIVGSKFTAIAGRGLGFELRKNEFKKIQSFSFKNLDNYRVDSLITRLTSDITIIQDWFCQSFRASLRSPTLLIFSLVLAFIISPYLGIIFLIAIPLLAALLIILIKIARPKFSKMQSIVDNLNRVTQESIIAIKTIKSYVKEDYEVEKFQEVNSKLQITSSSAFSTISLNMPSIQLITYATIIALLSFGASFFSKGLIQDVSEISTFLSYIMQLLSALLMLSNVFMLTNRANASLVRVIEVINTNNDIVDGKSNKEIESGDIEFNNVYFKYNEKATKYVLSDINYHIKSGSTIGIFGETGSGKTSFINLIERFYDVSEGELLIDNLNIKDYKISEIHDKIGICFQNPTLFSGSILDNLRWGNKDATMEEIIEACKITCCYDFIVNNLSNGFDTQMSQDGINVSGGQRQRICLARALLKKPKILILDDSFSALDYITETIIKENLRKLKNITIIIISQKINSIKDADDIVVLKEGKILNHGNHNYLIQNNEIYSNTYRIQNEGVLNEK